MYIDEFDDIVNLKNSGYGLHVWSTFIDFFLQIYHVVLQWDWRGPGNISAFVDALLQENTIKEIHKLQHADELPGLPYGCICGRVFACAVDKKIHQLSSHFC